MLLAGAKDGFIPQTIAPAWQEASISEHGQPEVSFETDHLSVQQMGHQQWAPEFLQPAVQITTSAQGPCYLDKAPMDNNSMHGPPKLAARQVARRSSIASESMPEWLRLKLDQIDDLHVQQNSINSLQSGEDNMGFRLQHLALQHRRSTVSPPIRTQV